MSFTEKTVVITGASGGIGRAIAMEFARVGAAVVVHYRSDQASTDDLVDAIRKDGGQAVAVQADLADRAQQQRLVDEAWQWRSGVDVWVNNAGVDILTGQMRDRTFDEKLDALLELDTGATVRLSRSIGRLMRERGTGVITNIGWDGAERGMSGDSAQLFAAAKGAVLAFSKSLAQSLAPEVRVNCVSPGWVRTDWARTAPKAWQQRAVDESLMNRWGEPQDIARAVRFLASDDASMINGQTLNVNGGFRFG